MTQKIRSWKNRLPVRFSVGTEFRAGALAMGYLSYSLVRSGLERNEADWQPKDGIIWLREWLAYGPEQTPKIV